VDHYLSFACDEINDCLRNFTRYVKQVSPEYNKASDSKNIPQATFLVLKQKKDFKVLAEIHTKVH